MNNVSSDEEDEEDEINICTDLKFEVLPDASDQLTNGMLPDASRKGCLN